MENGLGITTKLFRAISKLFSIHYTLKSSENYMVLYIMFILYIMFACIRES